MVWSNPLQQAAIIVGSVFIFITMASHPLGTQCPSEVKLSAEVGSSPPFLDLSGIQVIVQAGVPRTASTFQFYLLCAMVTLHTETEASGDLLVRQRPSQVAETSPAKVPEDELYFVR
jgi:hypothetical protein